MLHSGSLAAGDWDVMHGAVALHLHAILESSAHGTRLSEPSALAVRTHALALECVTALDQLRAAMAIDRDNQRRLELELHEAREALEKMQLEFQDSQAGELQARHLSLHDELTALPNRRHSREQLNKALVQACAHRTTAALLFLDLDGFKAINDLHGHETGDEVLRIVAARLSRAVRAGDVVCREGGDEFLCLPLGPMGATQLAHLARKLFDAVSAPLALHHLHLAIRPSIGVAIYPIHADDTDALLKAADAAMYRAKQCRLAYVFAHRGDGIEQRP